MSITSTTQDTPNVSFWQKSLNWVRAFEEAMDSDPTQSAIDRLNHQVTELKGTVRKLETQLGDRDVERS